MDRDEREDGAGGTPDDGAGGDEASGAEPAPVAGPEDPTDPELAPPSAPMLGRVPPVNRAMARVGRRLGGRPLAVYGVLAAGGVVLLILLLIVWFSAGDDGNNDTPICTETSPLEAVGLIKGGDVDRITIDSPRPDEGEIDGEIVLPALLRLGLTDGNCRNLEPQGPSGEIEMYTVLGAAEWYNGKTPQRRIEIETNEIDSIPPGILATVTPTPEPTVPVTETPVEPATPAAETPIPTATPEPTAVPVGSPASLVVSPVASPGG